MFDSPAGQFDPERPMRPFAGALGEITVHGPGSAGRGRVETFLEEAYGRAFDGVLRRHYPELISIARPDGRVAAAAGIRFAADEPLFLERYLDQPVEAEMAAVFGATVKRGAIAEIGNLAGESPLATLRLFAALAARLDGAGCSHAVATATRQLRRKFGRMGFATRRLAPALAARLGTEAQDWGGYYATQPEVLAGAVAPTLALLQGLLGPHREQAA